MNRIDPFEAGFQPLNIPDPWEMAAIIKAKQRRRRQSKSDGGKSEAPPELRTTLHVFLPQR